MDEKQVKMLEMFVGNSSHQLMRQFATAPRNFSMGYGSFGGYQRGYHTFLVVLALFIIIHNSFVLFLYMKKRALRTTSNMLLASTASGDILTGALMIPFLISSAAMFNKGLDTLYFTSNVISDFITLVIVLNLLMVTLERYISLCHPYLHPELAKKSVIRWMIVLTWVFSFIIAIIPLSWDYAVIRGENKNTESEYKAYSLFTLIGVFFVPTMVIIYCLIAMFMVIRKFVQQDRQRGVPMSQGIRAQGKAVFVFLFMFLNMFVCWSPLMCIRLAMDTDPEFRPSSQTLEILVAFRCCSSLINPAIYVWCKKDFKRMLLRTICRKTNSNNSAITYTRNTQENKVTYKESLL